MKALTFITKNFKNIMIGVLIVFLIIALMRCNGQKNRNQELASAAKSLEQKVKADSIARNEEREAFQAEKKETEGRRQLAEVEKGEADNKVKQQQKTIDRLTGIVRNSVWVANSSEDFVTVTPEYKAACDSLPAEIDKLNVALAVKDSAIKGVIDLYDYEIQIRDEEVFKEMNYSDSLKADFVRQSQLLKSALNQGKPRGRLLGGISILGNQNQFLSGAGVVLAYQTKGGKQYQVSPKFIKVPGAEAEVYYEGTVLFTIFK